jgi:hypothetical protein
MQKRPRALRRACGRLALAIALVGAAGCDVRVVVLEPAGGGATWTTEPATAADAFVEMLSVGTHLATTTPANDNYAVVKRLLGDLGVRHAMDLSAEPDLGRIGELGATGVGFQVWIDALGTYFQSALAAGRAVEAFQVDPLAGGMVPDEAAQRARLAFCADLYAAVKGSAHAAAVVGPDVALPVSSPIVDFGPCVDYGTVHRERTARPATFKDLMGESLDDQWAAERPRAAGRPLMLGLEGYGTNPADPAGAVSETVQAKYLARLAFEAFNRGFVRAYLGGVTDRPDEQNPASGARAGAVAQGFGPNEGLAQLDGTPKASFTAFRNLVTLLGDRGQPAAAGYLRYRLDAPATVHHTLLEKRDGTYVLALWLEVASTDAPTTVPVTLHFPGATAQVTTFTPRAGATATEQRAGVRDLDLDVADDVTLVQIAVDDHCDRSKWKASGSAPVGSAFAIDGDLTTRWANGKFQDGSDWFAVDFGGPVTLSSITLNDAGAYRADYPGAYEVRGSLDGVTFVDPPFVAGNGAEGATVIDFAPRTLRAVKVSQVGTANPTHWWGIGEFQMACTF